MQTILKHAATNKNSHCSQCMHSTAPVLCHAMQHGDNTSKTDALVSSKAPPACVPGNNKQSGCLAVHPGATAATYIQNVPCEHKASKWTKPITTTHHCVRTQQDIACLQTSTQAHRHGASTP
jgi:hypothetical protein